MTTLPKTMAARCWLKQNLTLSMLSVCEWVCVFFRLLFAIFSHMVLANVVFAIVIWLQQNCECALLLQSQSQSQSQCQCYSQSKSQTTMCKPIFNDPIHHLNGIQSTENVIYYAIHVKIALFTCPLLVSAVKLKILPYDCFVSCMNPRRKRERRRMEQRCLRRALVIWAMCLLLSLSPSPPSLMMGTLLCFVIVAAAGVVADSGNSTPEHAGTHISAGC